MFIKRKCLLVSRDIAFSITSQNVFCKLGRLRNTFKNVCLSKFFNSFCVPSLSVMMVSVIKKLLNSFLSHVTYSTNSARASNLRHGIDASKVTSCGNQVNFHMPWGRSVSFGFQDIRRMKKQKKTRCCSCLYQRKCSLYEIRESFISWSY